MPYITQEARNDLDDNGFIPGTAGELNYKITKLINEYMISEGGTSYQVINEIIGALECAKIEFYRRIAVPYEDRKIEDNGDVY